MAADPEGVVRFRAGDTEYKLHFGFRAQKETEIKFDKPFMQAIQEVLPAVDPADADNEGKARAEFEKISFGDLGALFGFGLLKHHGEVDDQETEEIFDEVGTIGAVGLLMRSIQAAMTKGADRKALEGAGGRAPAGPPRSRKR